MIGAACFAVVYVFLWSLYPRKYFSEYILTDYRVLGYVLYVLTMGEIVVYGLAKILQKRFFLAAASFLTASFVFWIMVYPPSSYDHFEYFMYALAFAVAILVIDFFGGRLWFFMDSKETAMIVMMLTPVVILFVIIAAASSPIIEKAVIGIFLAALVARTIWPDFGRM